ncbi:methylated-DNA--[protein]-cysteine S-methyltransferase [candidate division KSB1 bacterium]|nr:methylated-DNA--[protein]-cysteine S-methyltransferase [candidate division KSB1 bacterium]
MYYSLFKKGTWHLLLVGTEKGLSHIQYLQSQDLRPFLERYKIRYNTDIVGNPDLFRPWQKEFDRYFEGEYTDLKVPLDIKTGTLFQKKVWSALRSIPYGRTMTYGQLARTIEHPKAFRAVGNANGANPLPIVLPCHRVIAGGGNLGGYSSGPDIKRALLRLEGIFV